MHVISRLSPAVRCRSDDAFVPQSQQNATVHKTSNSVSGTPLRVYSMSMEAWKTVFEIGGVILLFLTFVFGAGAVLTTNRLNKRQAAQLRQFDKQLTAAKLELASQQERTANADARVAGLEKDAANAKSEMAKQQTRAANAEKALLKLQQRLEPRRISRAQHGRFVAALRPYAGSTLALTKLGDLEAGTFADDILSVLADAGWHVNLRIVGVMGPPAYGLKCSINEQSRAGESLATVMGQLPTAAVEPDRGTSLIANIIVGLKPPP